MNSNKFRLDLTIILVLILLCIVSSFTLFELQPTLSGLAAQTQYMPRQIMWYILGAVVIAVMMLLDYDRLRQLVWIFYGIGIVMLLMLFFKFPAAIINEANGATSWFILPGIGSMQPAEFVKVFVVIALAHVIMSHNEKHTARTNKTDLFLLAKLFAVALPPMLLVASQPDLGGFLVLGAILGATILVSGISWRLLLTILGIVLGIGVFVAILSFIFPNQVGGFLQETIFKHVESRFLGWLYPEKYPDSSYQYRLGLMAIGSGILFGKGASNFQVSIPERHTDYIFSAIAEQFGFIGSAIVLFLFFILIYRMIQVGLESNEPFGSYLAAGFIGMFTYQIFQNIGMSVGLVPITGLPLPFLSYGGSSTLAYMIAIGIVLNIHSRTRTFMFETQK